MTTTRPTASRWWSLPIVLAYLVGLALPAVYRPGFGAPTSGLTGSVVYGYECLGSLPFALLSPSWWANPVWLLGVITLVRQNLKWARACGVVATLLALSIFAVGPFPPDNFHLSDMRPGYYVWLGSLLALFVTAHLQIQSPSQFTFGQAAHRTPGN